MARKVNSDQIDQVDEILNHAEPEFMKELSEINGDELKLAELEAAFAEAEQSNTPWNRFWNDISPLQRWGSIGGGLGVILGAAFLIWYLVLNSIALGDKPSLESIADSSFDFDMTAAPKNLIDHFLVDEYLFEIPDHVFYLKAKRDIRVGRFSFYLELGTKEDFLQTQQHEDEIIETLNLFFAKIDVDDFKGIEGKEAIKRRMLAALSERLPIKFKNVRFSLLVFN